MMQVVSTKKNVAMVVFNIGEQIHFTTLEKYAGNPNVLDANAPKFRGSFDECVKYISEVI
jgi:hypothetical protein